MTRQDLLPSLSNAANSQEFFMFHVSAYERLDIVIETEMHLKTN